MSNNYYDKTVPVFITSLNALLSMLDKVENYCIDNEVDESAFTQFRLYPNMHGFVKQVQIACDSAKNAIYRIANEDLPVFEDAETTLVELKDRVSKTIKLIETFNRSQLDDAEDSKVAMGAGPGSQVEFGSMDVYVNQFAIPNFYFHMTTVYNILRHNGIDLGKQDFIGAIDAQIISV